MYLIGSIRTFFNVIAKKMDEDKVKQVEETQLKGVFKQGALAAWPLCFGYFPLGLALGVLAQQAGIPAWLTGLMSVFLFAGSAQFICVAMLGAGASLATIVTTIFVVNLRHALMSSALAIYLKGVNRWFLALFAYGITDETFAVNMGKFRQGSWDKWRALTVNHLSNSAWVLSTFVGSLVGQFIPENAYGIGYALTAMFICLLVYQLTSRIMVVTAVITAAIAVLWHMFIPGNSYIVGASVCGASIGFFIKRAKEQST